MSEKRKNINLKLNGEESDWWDEFAKDNYPNEQCLKNFRCSQKTFLYLVKFLKPYITPKIGASTDIDIYLRKGVSVEKQIAVLLYKLTTNSDYVTISKKFKVHKTTIHKIIYKCVLALNKYLLHDVIIMPKQKEAESIAKDFECSYKLPQTIGVMEIVHIPIISPLLLNYQFLNTLLYPSFILQTVIDSNCFFRDISVRHAGAAELHTIITDSNIYKYFKNVIPPTTRNINGKDVSYKIIGPIKGPLYTWMLNDYSPVISSSETVFNENLREIRDYASTVVMRLRSRFFILSQAMDISYKVAPQIIAACCIIHNLCEKNEDPVLEEWQNRYSELIKKYPQPNMDGKWKIANNEALEERDAIRDFTTDQGVTIECSQDMLNDVLTKEILNPTIDFI